MENETMQGQTPPQPAPAGAKSNVTAGLLAIFLGCLGIHKFYLGYTKAALIMLISTVVGNILGWGLIFLVVPGILLLAPFGMWVIGIIEGIMYLTKSPEEFNEIYVKNEKQWF